MKKLFLISALAFGLMSFSFGAENSKLKPAKSETMLATNCFGVWVFVYNQALAQGFTTSQALALAGQAFDDCVGGNPFNPNN